MKTYHVFPSFGNSGLCSEAELALRASLSLERKGKIPDGISNIYLRRETSNIRPHQNL